MKEKGNENQGSKGEGHTSGALKGFEQLETHIYLNILAGHFVILILELNNICSTNFLLTLISLVFPNIYGNLATISEKKS